MSPGINGNDPRNKGTMPKNNRRNDHRNREQPTVQQIANRLIEPCHSGHSGHSQEQYFNNLFQLEWQLNEREPRVSRAAKNSNTRASSASSLPYIAYLPFHQDLSDCASNSSGRQCNYTPEEYLSWPKMVLPTDSRTQSPPRTQSGTKPSNVNKMPDRSQVESRLNQIKEYISSTATIMDSLSQCSEPRAKVQHDKLRRLVDDLHDSEMKLTKLLEQHEQISDELDASCFRRDVDERGDAREMQLRRNMEEYQNKLVQLQEHQANLAGMQIRVRERLNEARQAQQLLLQQENQNESNSTCESNLTSLPGPANVEQLESETEVLRGKLAQLQTKKKHMDHLMAELQAIEASDRSSCSSEGSRNTMRDRAVELEAMKAQLAHIKALMEENDVRLREPVDSSELEQDVNAEVDVNGEGAVDGITEDVANISFDCRSDSDDIGHGKFQNSVPTIEDIQNVTRELKEQSALLQAARAELQRLKQPLPAFAPPASSSSFSSSSPPPALIPLNAGEKKQSNNVSTETQAVQAKRCQLKDLIKKEQAQSSNVNRDIQVDQNSQRSSGSQASHTSTSANIWPASTAAGDLNEQSVDGISTSENLLDIGPQTIATENGGFNGNWWACPVPPPTMNQGQPASIEFYRQLLLGSQAQQLQMMGTTLQHCCQLLWTQQRELQSMRTAITQLQLQTRSPNQTPQRVSNIENQEEYSNLSRNVHNLGDTLDATLPPSSSLPNLVSLPNSSAALSHTPIVTSNSQQQQQQQQQQHQQQLNNQVPPGNRANNYWDNFRSYSRQNLLSGNVKTESSTAIANSSSSANTTNTSGNSVNSSLIKDKRNREQGTDNLPLPLIGAEAQYSLNLQLPSNLQQQDRENATIRSNIIANEVSQQVDNLWEETHSSFRVSSGTNDDNLNNLSLEMKGAISSLIAANKKRPDYLIIILREIKTISEDHRLRSHLLRTLRALQNTQTLNNPLNEVSNLTPSESCQSSDEDSDVGAMQGFYLENQSEMTEYAVPLYVDTACSPSSQAPLIEHLEIPGTFSLDCASALPSTSNAKSAYNEDLAEADQSRPDSSRNSHQKFSTNDMDNEDGQEEAASYPIAAEAATPDLDGLTDKTEDERVEDNCEELDELFTRYH